MHSDCILMTGDLTSRSSRLSRWSLVSSARGTRSGSDGPCATAQQPHLVSHTRHSASLLMRCRISSVQYQKQVEQHHKPLRSFEFHESKFIFTARGIICLAIMSGRLIAARLRPLAQRTSPVGTRHLHHHTSPSAGGLLRSDAAVRAARRRLWPAGNIPFSNAVAVRNASFMRIIPQLLLKFARIPALFGGATIAGLAYIQYQAARTLPFWRLEELILTWCRGWKLRYGCNHINEADVNGRGRWIIWRCKGYRWPNLEGMGEYKRASGAA